MDFEGCKKKIDRFLSKDNVQPLLVDVQNPKDLSSIVTHYNIGANRIMKASDYCKKDEFLQIEAMFHELETKPGVYFVIGLTSFLKLQGEQELRKALNEILNMSIVGHVVVVTYQCCKFLNFIDPRLQPRIVIFDGYAQKVSDIYFSTSEQKFDGIQMTKGIESFSDAVECLETDKLPL